MGTRANIVIEHGASRVYLYRHWDGYLAETGADLARRLAGRAGSASAASALLEELLAERYDDRPEKRIYELTSEVHGDIEFLYRVDFGGWDHPAPRIGWRQYRPGDDRSDDAVSLDAVAPFVAAVNRDIREQNARLDQLKRSQPAAYADYQPSPEVA